jgi:hypothetical protein
MGEGFEEKLIKYEHWAKATTQEGFERWVKLGFWKDSVSFYIDTGVKFEDIKDKWFQVVHNRVYLKEDQI